MLGGLLCASFAHRLGWSVTGGATKNFVTEFAVCYFMKGYIHKSHPRCDRDHWAVAEAKLAHAFGDHIDQDLRATDFSKG